jgi:hypothetical protein
MSPPHEEPVRTTVAERAEILVQLLDLVDAIETEVEVDAPPRQGWDAPTFRELCGRP